MVWGEGKGHACWDVEMNLDVDINNHRQIEASRDLFTITTEA